MGQFNDCCRDELLLFGPFPLSININSGVPLFGLDIFGIILLCGLGADICFDGDVDDCFDDDPADLDLFGLRGGIGVVFLYRVRGV